MKKRVNCCKIDTNNHPCPIAEVVVCVDVGGVLCSSESSFRSSEVHMWIFESASRTSADDALWFERYFDRLWLLIYFLVHNVLFLALFPFPPKGGRGEGVG